MTSLKDGNTASAEDSRPKNKRRINSKERVSKKSKIPKVKEEHERTQANIEGFDIKNEEVIFIIKCNNGTTERLPIENLNKPMKDMAVVFAKNQMIALQKVMESEQSEIPPEVKVEPIEEMKPQIEDRDNNGKMFFIFNRNNSITVELPVYKMDEQLKKLALAFAQKEMMIALQKVCNEDLCSEVSNENNLESLDFKKENKHILNYKQKQAFFMNQTDLGLDEHEAHIKIEDISI